MFLLVALVSALGFLTPRSGTAGGSVDELVEASMNFDPEMVEPFLIKVSDLVEAGFSADIARRTAAEILALPVDAEKTWNFSVTFDGKKVPLRIEAFMDDIDAPDLALFAPADLAAEINKELDKYME